MVVAAAAAAGLCGGKPNGVQAPSPRGSRGHVAHELRAPALEAAAAGIWGLALASPGGLSLLSCASLNFLRLVRHATLAATLQSPPYQGRQGE